MTTQTSRNRIPIPTPRLILATSVIGLPCAVLSATLPETAPMAMMLLVMVSVATVIDLLLSQKLLSGVSAELPAKIRQTRHRRGSFDIRIQNTDLKALQIKMGLAFPSEVGLEEIERHILIPAAPHSFFRWYCTPRERGAFPAQGIALSCLSQLGFWELRTWTPTTSVLCSFPNLHEEQKPGFTLFLNRGNHGARALRSAGQGRDFEKLREYIPGDSYTDIHWKATAKRGRPVTKIHQIERTQQVYVAIDHSRLSGRIAAAATRPGRPPERVLDRFVNAALTLAVAAENQGDLFGLMHFSDRVRGFAPARTGLSHYDTCREMLYTLESEAVSPDHEDLFSFTRIRLRKRALLVVLTSLDEPIAAETFLNSVRLVSRQHLVMVCMLRPHGIQPLFSDQPMSEGSDLYQALAGHMLWSRLRRVELSLRRMGVHFHLLESSQLCTEAVGRYMKIKERQLV